MLHLSLKHDWFTSWQTKLSLASGQQWDDTVASSLNTRWQQTLLQEIQILQIQLAFAAHFWQSKSYSSSLAEKILVYQFPGKLSWTGMLFPEFSWGKTGMSKPERPTSGWPQGHRVELRNSRSSARFLSRCRKTNPYINLRKWQCNSQTEKTHLDIHSTAIKWDTCLSFFDFFTFIFIFFPEIMLYFPPFFLSFKYWKRKKCSRFKGNSRDTCHWLNVLHIIIWQCNNPMIKSTTHRTWMEYNGHGPLGSSKWNGLCG